MSKIVRLFSNFRIRKRVLAIADAFILVVSGMYANFLLPLYADTIDCANLFPIFLLSVVLCFSSLLFFGFFPFFLMWGKIRWESALSQAEKCITNLCGKTGLPIKVLAYFIGRTPIKFDNKDIRDYIENKVCMETGGAGRIDCEFISNTTKFDFKQIKKSYQKTKTILQSTLCTKLFSHSRLLKSPTELF